MQNTSRFQNYELSPYNSDLRKLMKPFVGKDIHRLSYNGICFDENGAVATDGFVFMLIRYKDLKESKYVRGIFTPDTCAIINELYPDYPKSLIQEHPYFVEFNTIELLEKLKLGKKTLGGKYEYDGSFCQIKSSELRFLNRDKNNVLRMDITIPAVSNAINQTIPLKIELLIKLLEVLKSQGIIKAKMYFTSSNRAINFYVKTLFGEMTLLLMPYYSSREFKENDVEGFSENKDKNPANLGSPLKREQIYIDSDLQYRAESLKTDFNLYAKLILQIL